MADDENDSRAHHLGRGRGGDSGDMRDVWSAIEKVRDDAVAVALRTSNHEVLCAERYKEINGKLKYLLGAVTILTVSQLFGLDHAVKAFLHLAGISP